MQNADLTSNTGSSIVTSDKTNKVTQILLTGGVIAGPLYIAMALIQGLTRPGFDLLHNDVSLLSNGNLGWIQITNFLVTGVLVIAGAAGMRRMLRGSQGGTWGPLLIGVFGLGLIGAGIFIADPMNGFPPGTPAGMPAAISQHGWLHILFAAIGFLSLITACFIIARRFAVHKQRSWEWFSVVVTGVIFLASFIGVTTGSSQALIVIGFWIGIILAFAWISLLAARLMAEKSQEKI